MWGINSEGEKLSTPFIFLSNVFFLSLIYLIIFGIEKFQIALKEESTMRIIKIN